MLDKNLQRPWLDHSPQRSSLWSSLLCQSTVRSLIRRRKHAGALEHGPVARHSGWLLVQGHPGLQWYNRSVSGTGWPPRCPCSSQRLNKSCTPRDTKERLRKGENRNLPGQKTPSGEGWSAESWTGWWTPRWSLTGS